MHRALTARWIGRAFNTTEIVGQAGVPLFLCPALAAGRTGVVRPWSGSAPSPGQSKRTIGLCQRRSNHSAAIASDPQPDAAPLSTAEYAHEVESKLPINCSGCGAFSQTTDPDQFGYFTPDSKRVRNYVFRHEKAERRKQSAEAEEDKVVEDVIKTLDPSRLKELGLSPELLQVNSEVQETEENAVPTVRPPVCDRCHDLIHHDGTTTATKVQMFHPTVESLRETIEESPHKNNHIYHIIDAADFPMSLVPRLNVLLGDIPLRTRNRRSRSEKYMKDRKTEMSFIITRSDLLGPTQKIVDSMMPYFRQVLRDALGRLGSRVRLGNIRCVSAKRGWWTGVLKEDIWKRGGGGWMVGKVNVGKSQLFEAVYPKGRLAKPTTDGKYATKVVEAPPEDPEELRKTMDFGDLLPPAQPLEMYPEMPLVSSLPGTTASPIRVPFGDGKGELIDLPGLARGDLEFFVKDEHRRDLIMKSRIVPEQISLEAGKSLILGGGLIRITPKTPNLTFLAYNFTPINEHLTSNEKAIQFQNQERESSAVENITIPGAGEKMKLADTVKLRYDVTKLRAGPLTRKEAVGMSMDRLPFRVVSVDILIEGVGYVEVTAQVRKREFEGMAAKQAFQDASAEAQTEAEEEAARARYRETKAPEPVAEKVPLDPFERMMGERVGAGSQTKRKVPERKVPERKPVAAMPQPKISTPEFRDWPEVEVYTPEGRFIDYRQPIQGWMYNKPLVLDKHKRARPRKSMRGQKKAVKLAARAAV